MPWIPMLEGVYPGSNVTSAPAATSGPALYCGCMAMPAPCPAALNKDEALVGPQIAAARHRQRRAACSCGPPTRKRRPRAGLESALNISAKVAKDEMKW